MLVVLGAACCLRAYFGLRGIHAVPPVPVLKGQEPTFVLTEVRTLMRISYLGVGLIVTGVAVAIVGAALLAAATRKAQRTAEST